MTRSKLTLAPWLFLAGLVGCSFQDGTPSGAVRVDPGAPNHRATCSATRTTLVPRAGRSGSSVTGSQNADVDAFGLPRRQLFQFRTCLVDRATSLPLRGVDVTVIGGDRPQKASADPVGCVDWVESVEYRRLAPEKQLAWPRTLEVGGSAVRLELALDPWARGSDALVDYTGTTKPEGLVEGRAVQDVLAGRGDFSPARALGKETTNLYASQLTVRSREDGVGTRGSRVAYHLSFQLAAGRRTLDGNWARETLTAGKFKVTFGLWEQRASDAAEALSAPVTVDGVTLKDGALDVRATAEFQRAFADGAKLSLRYKIEPDDAEKLLMPSEGWMQLRSVVTTETAVPTLVPPDRVREGEPRQGPAGSTAAVGYLVRSLSVTKFKVGVARDWNLPIDVKAKVCLTTADDRQTIVPTSTRQFSFQISSEPAPGRAWVSADELQDNCFVVRKADAVGCEIAQKERYLPMYLHLRSEDSRFGNAVQTRRFALNPWQRDRQEQFFVDLPDGKEVPSFEDGTSNGDGVSQLVLQNVTYEFVGKTAKVNEYLQNAGLRQYRLTLRPRLWSPWRSHSGHDETEPVFRGLKFRAHGIFSTPPSAAAVPSAAHYLGEFVTDFEVQDGGEASRTIVLPVDFPEAHRLRSAVVLTLRLTPMPTNDRRRPHARTYRFSFDPLVDRSSGNSKTESSFLSREVSYGDYLALVPSGGEPAKGNFDGFEEKIPRSPAIQRFEVDGAVGYGLQPKFRGTPVDLFARYWKDAVGVRPVHLSDDRRDDGWAFWNGGAPIFPDSTPNPVALPDLDRNALRELLEGPVARGASVALPAPLLEKLCAYYASGDASCREAPGQYFDAVTTLVAGKVSAPETSLSPLDAEGQLAARIAVQASFFKETGYSERASRGDKSAWTAATGLQSKMGKENLGTGGGFVGSVGYGIEEYHTTEIGVVDGLRNRRGYAMVYEIRAMKFPVRLRVDGNACLLVRPYQSGGTARPALLYCATVTNVDRSENYYELVDASNGPPTVVGDPTDPAQRGWLRTLRGDPALRRVQQRLMDDTNGAVFHKIGPWIERFSANLTRSPKAMVEGTAMDSFSAEGAEALVARDGGLFPGVFEMNPAVASFQENWSEKAFGEKMHAVYQGVVAAGLETSRIPFVVRKDDHGKDIRVPDLVSEGKRSETFRYLRQARAYSRCLVAEYARRCSLGLYETDRPLCLTKNRKAARAVLEPQLEAERKKLNGECAALAKGAFP